MNVTDYVVLATYALLVVELVVIPIPSEASTLQLFRPSAATGEVGGDDALARARERGPFHKLLRFALPTAIGVLLWLVPLSCLLSSAVAEFCGAERTSLGDWIGGSLIVVGSVVRLVASLQLRSAKRRGELPGGIFGWSRNPGLVGMYLTFIGLTIVCGVHWLWLGLPLYVLNMHGRVRLEESHLLARHGDRWREYAARIPRYVGWPRATGDAPPVEQNEVAAWFDRTYREKGFSYLRPPRAYPIFLQLLGASSGQHVLDVACGPGLLLRAAVERGLDASGVDLSAAAIAMAREHLPQADTRQGNAEELPFEADQFDFVTCLGSIERFLDREQALGEMLRVTRPDARFCFLVRNANTFVWRFWREGLGHREVEGHQDAKTIEEWRALFARVGFAVEDVLPDQWPRQRWRQLFPWWRPRPGRREPVARPLLPLRWCNELVFVLRRSPT